MENATPRRKPGRPKGSRNRPKEAVATENAIKDLYHKFKPFMNAEQREYVEQIITGEVAVDPLYEMQLLVRQMSLVLQQSMAFFFENGGKVNIEIGQFSNALRMAIKDLEDISVKRAEREEKQRKEVDQTNGLVPITQGGTTLEGLKRFFTEDELS